MRKIALMWLTLLQGCATSGIPHLREHELALSGYHEHDTWSFLGSLTYEDRCLLFRDESGTTRLLPIWPLGSSFEESLITFHRPGKADQRITIGEEIRLDGQPAEWVQLSADYYKPFQRCGGRPFFVTSLAPAD